MRMMILSTLTAFSLQGPLAQAQSYDDYNFMLEPMGSIKSTCTEGHANKESKINLIPLMDKSGSNYVPLLFKLKLCLKTWGFRKVNITVNVPKEIFNQNLLLGMSEGNVLSFSDIPSTQEAGRKLKINLTRLPEKTIRTRRGQKTQAIPYSMSWVNGGGSVTEYQPITLYVVRDPNAFSSVSGFVPGKHMPWLRIEFDHKHKMLSSPLQMRGILGLMALE